MKNTIKLRKLDKTTERVSKILKLNDSFRYFNLSHLKSGCVLIERLERKMPINQFGTVCFYLKDGTEARIEYGIQKK